MAKINWTFQALEDLNDIGEYLSQNSDTYAQYIIDLLWEKAHLLENYPKLGKKVPESNLPNFRELLVKNYRIIYSLPNNNQVNILAVRHISKK